MLSSGKESVVVPSAGNQSDATEIVEIETSGSKSADASSSGTQYGDTPVTTPEAMDPQQEHCIARDRPRRHDVRKPARYDDESHFIGYALAVAEEIEEVAEPKSYSEAISCANSSKWLVAMQEEVESLHKNDTWDLVKLPKGKRVITCKWIYKKKDGIPGVEDARFKAR